MIRITTPRACTHGISKTQIGQSVSKGENAVIWFDFPMRLRTALKCLCCLAATDQPIRSPEIAEKAGVSPAETAKVLQLLILGGFVTSRRGSKGGFQLARSSSELTTGEVIDFFLAKHPTEPAAGCAVMQALDEAISPGQEAFAKLTLAEIATRYPKDFLNSSLPLAGAE